MKKVWSGAARVCLAAIAVSAFALPGCSKGSQQAARPEGAVSVRPATAADLEQLGAFNRAALARNPDDVEAHRGMVMYYTQKRDKPNTIKHLREVVRLDPGDRESTYILASRLRRSQNKNEAVKIFRDLAKQNDKYGRGAQTALLVMKRREQREKRENAKP